MNEKTATAPSFSIRTFGCQMNVHDSDKVANLLHHEGFSRAVEEAEADLLLINTCSIREKAEHRLYSDLGTLREWKEARPDRLIGVGGCVAQQEGDTILRRFSHVDFVFGTHNLRRVPALIRGALEGRRRAQTEETRSLERFDLPERHVSLGTATPGRAFVTVMEGCDMFCAFCIVPRTRGREISRPEAAILDEARRLVDDGVREITLLGQTVNAYGRPRPQGPRSGPRREPEADEVHQGLVPFAELLTRLDRIQGLERIRYTSPHPIFFDEALIRAHGELEHLCPHVHLPAQSGSDRVLERMRRRYRAEDLRVLAERLRAARPDLVLTTDLIVGFPGERDDDFEDTLRLVHDLDFVDAYSFKYSARPGTAAERFEDEVPPAVAQARLERLQAQQRDQTLQYHQRRVGQKVEVLLEGSSRRGNQASGRDPYHRVVNLVEDPKEVAGLLPGGVVHVEILEATQHSLIGSVAPGELCPTSAASPL